MNGLKLQTVSSASLPVPGLIRRNGLVAQAQGPRHPAPASDLLGTPPLGERRQYLRPVGGRETAVASGLTPPGPGQAVGVVPLVAAPTARIAGQLPMDRAPVAAEPPGDLGDREPEPAELGHLISFVQGDLLIRHRLRSLGRRSEVYTGAVGHPACCTQFMNVPVPSNHRMKLTRLRPSVFLRPDNPPAIGSVARPRLGLQLMRGR